MTKSPFPFAEIQSQTYRELPLCFIECLQTLIHVAFYSCSVVKLSAKISNLSSMQSTFYCYPTPQSLCFCMKTTSDKILWTVDGVSESQSFFCQLKADSNAGYLSILSKLDVCLLHSVSVPTQPCPFVCASAEDLGQDNLPKFLLRRDFADE